MLILILIKSFHKVITGATACGELSVVLILY